MHPVGGMQYLHSGAREGFPVGAIFNKTAYGKLLSRCVVEET